LRARPDNVVAACSDLADEHISVFDAVLPKAVAGDRGSIRTYVGSWRELLDKLLQAIRTARPDLALEQNGRFVLFDGQGAEAAYAVEMIAHHAADAPFTPWVTVFGTGPGTVVSMVNELRTALRDIRPLAPLRSAALPSWGIDRSGFERFSSLVVAELEGLTPQIEQIMRIFDLTITETAGLYGVSRQAVSRWIDEGELPRFRREKTHTILSIARLLERNLRPGTVPVVSRRPARAYHDRSILQAIIEDEHDAVLAEVRGSFDWSAMG